MGSYDGGIQKSFRLLSLYERLHQGEQLVKQREADRFQVNPKTIQRDLEDIRVYLEEQGSARLCYDPKKRGYLLQGQGESWLKNAEILLMSKILLESRALQKEEMDTLLKKLMEQAAPEDRDHMEDVLLNEKHHYVPVAHQKPLIQTIWELSKAVQQKRLLEMEYQSLGRKKKTNLVKPVGLIFSEYYFYLLAYLTESTYDYPTVFRIDRILNYSLTDEPFRIPYLDRFEEGEFRKRVQFMFSGELIRVYLIYQGDGLEAILDRLPTARVIRKENGRFHIKAHVFGPGIKMWILSQGTNLEVIKPDPLREDIQKTLQEMLSQYKD